MGPQSETTECSHEAHLSHLRNVSPAPYKFLTVRTGAHCLQHVSAGGWAVQREKTRCPALPRAPFSLTQRLSNLYQGNWFLSRATSFASFRCLPSESLAYLGPVDKRCLKIVNCSVYEDITWPGPPYPMLWFSSVHNLWLYFLCSPFSPFHCLLLGEDASIEIFIWFELLWV